MIHPAWRGPPALAALQAVVAMGRPWAMASPASQGVTLTLWSTCGLSRGGLYGEWQGVICTGENSSQVQVRALVPGSAPRVAGVPGMGTVAGAGSGAGLLQFALRPSP